MSIHSTALIDPSAKIGNGVSIGPYAIIGPDAVVGDRCEIRAHASIEHTELGPECVVFPYACLGFAPQHLGYKGEKTKVTVGARTVFREYVTAHRGTAFDKGVTTIGNDCYFMALSHVAHDCRIGNNVIMANSAQLAGHVEVGDRAFVSTSVGVHQFVRIGRCAMISGGAMVSLDVAPYCIAQGDRALLRGINIVGMRRAGIDRASIRSVKEAYKMIFLSGLPLKEALDHPDLNKDNEHVRIFREFLSQSKRGFVRPGKLAQAEPAEEEAAL